MTAQTEAQRLAEKMKSYKLASGYAWHCHKAGDELLRLEAANAELLDALNFAYTQATKHDERLPFDWALYCEALHMAIKKHGGQS